MSRREAVLAAFDEYPSCMGAAEMARRLNLPDPCDWCPVGPPRPGEQCASVPTYSRKRVERVVEGLIRDGLVEHRHKGTVMSVWVRRIK